MDKTLPTDKSILVLGSGNFGTCLAQHLANKGLSVTIWARQEEVARSINSSRRNPVYLSDIALSERIIAISKLDAAAFKDRSLVILAVPTQAARSVLQSIKPHISAETIVVSAAKGIENQTLALPLDIIKDVLGPAHGEKAVVLSGPSFAAEVIASQPTAVSLGSYSEKAALTVQSIFHTPYFRAYTSDDPVGLEVAGALKNVIAIAAGACAGLNFQQNSQAALLTRGLAEITRIGVRLGAQPLTFTGLGGVGDLFLTCSSTKSRNYSVGYRLGRGEELPHVLRTLGSVAEGVATAKAAWQLTQKLSVDAPITEQVHAVLYEGRPIKEAVMALMTREAKPELTLHQP